MIAAQVRLLLVTIATFLLAPAVARAAGDSSIFYYPWWGTRAQDGKYVHWSQYGHAPPSDLATTYYPARGPYSSSAPDVVRAQMEEIAAAGVSEVIASWWGWGSAEDARLPLLLRAAKRTGLTVAVHLEPYDGRTVATVVANVAHLRDLGIRRIYLYKPFALDATDWASLAPDLKGPELYAETTDVDRAVAWGFDGVYTYDVFGVRGGAFTSLCSRAHAAGLACAPSVGPGYNAERATGDRRIRSRRRGTTYDDMWRAAIAVRPDRITITSYNEWHEGTQIEPAQKRPRALFNTYQSYEGAYGKFGAAAERAYLVRTGYWTRMYRIAAAVTSTLRLVAVWGGSDAGDDVG